MSVNEAASSSVFERHLQSTLMAIAIGALGWVGVTVTSTQTTTARLEQAMASWEKSLDEFGARQIDRDERQDAEIKSLRDRMRTVEQRGI